jgi:hypothetical protein
MRIQETNGILKEARYSRAAAQHEQHHEEGVMSRAWRLVSNLPGKLTGLFRKS